MKTQFSLLITLLLLINIAWVSPIETKMNSSIQMEEGKNSLSTDFSFFRTHRQGRYGVTATWGLLSEAGIINYSLVRTYEDPNDPYANWETVCLMNCTNARSYKFTDNNLFPGYISYRVIANMIGGEIISPVSTVHIISH